MALNLFVDNDVILKLAQYGILEHLTKLFPNHHGETHLFALDSARYKLLPKRNRTELCKTEAAALCIEAFLEQATSLAPANVDIDVLERLYATPGIDAGEALLFAAAAKGTEGRVLTGDKRALAGLSDQHLEHVGPQLIKKVITLEALVQGFVALDADATQHAVRSNPAVDKALDMVFGISSAASAESVKAGLGSYIGHVRESLGAILNSGPPFD
ncbi:hypothetical protein NLO83_17640 [Pseudomonas tremae]|uniref:hypothetical protein n=1 Tax=Pseudomonas syringae group TaxID=136849 RepID=UPI0001AF50F4|nr:MULTISPECIES: hypothetical protein [Pseudomonas syringae group]MCQ3017406.1 hypothetical protein [Pseudomonas tremae]QGL59390.1 hypothetical protein POR16_25195 [Pseudomonas coronafaciens pv. oryzae str. 1_6]RMM34380.1 hypothetical protein ALQ80_02792 [Pseudomonas coronafaciens pv. oryzae]